MPADGKIHRNLLMKALLMSGRLLCCCIYMVLAMSGVSFAGVFDLPEISVAPSPADVRFLEFKKAEKVLDFDVAKDGPETAILIESQGGGKVLFWDPGSSKINGEWPAPKGFTPRALAWHPAAKSFFLAGKQGKEFVIMRVDKRGGGWEKKLIYRTRQEIRRLVPGPRPYLIENDFSGDVPKATSAYRIFFGIKNQDGTYSIKSVTEDGGREYQAIGSRKGFTVFKDSEVQPSSIETPWALPLSFHPAGHILLWEDENRSFHYAIYERDSWGQSIKLSYPGVSGGSLTATPNGLGLIHWLPGSAGITLVSLRGSKKDILAAEYSFLSTPSSVPDGKGIVGLIKKDNRSILAYVPVEMPLADVANAWMFSEVQDDQDLFSRKGGLLRDLPYDQLYSMYETEAYECGHYDPSTPTRPYLVSTDIFWELMAAAYEGIFIIKEREQAIPAFWEFVDEAEAYFRQAKPESHWATIFTVLESMRKPVDESEDVRAELLRIKNAADVLSPVFGRQVDYGELKPRGHYTSSEDMKTYFKAFKYLTMTSEETRDPNPLPLDDLVNLTPEIKARARSWISAYDFFIAPSRGPLVWGDTTQPPAYARYPLKRMRLFPLSWGMDNEVLFSTVYHEDLPQAEQIKGPPGGMRLIPSGLDIASALGSEFATSLLATEIEEYPPLGRVLAELRKRLAQSSKDIPDNTNLYDPWIAALGLQWADDVASPGGALDRGLWLAKRLQTGLASWATLRHATVLVNERTSAECGEAAFEPILLTPPRGYVEPDPRTFDAIATLFLSMEDLVKSWDVSSKETIPSYEGEAREALKEGIVRRLSETALKAKLFQTMAEKEIRGEPLLNEEYEEILLVGRVAEHHLLIFKSLANKDHALSEPDPMPKIVDAAGGGPYRIPYMMAAVGRPMEWDHIVPYFGRRQAVKASVYSYYEFTSKELIDDAEWLKSIPSQKHPSWIAPYLSGSLPACPPRNPY